MVSHQSMEQSEWERPNEAKERVSVKSCLQDDHSGAYWRVSDPFISGCILACKRDFDRYFKFKIRGTVFFDWLRKFHSLRVTTIKE